MKKRSGLDVHKDTIFCGVYNGMEKKLNDVKEYSTLTEYIRSMGEYLHSEGVEEVDIYATFLI